MPPLSPTARADCSYSTPRPGTVSEIKRRIPAADYLIAAAAAGRGAGVLHYDHHFDPLCRTLGIESIWIAPPGSID